MIRLNIVCGILFGLLLTSVAQASELGFQFEILNFQGSAAAKRYQVVRVPDQPGYVELQERTLANTWVTILTDKIVFIELPTNSRLSYFGGRGGEDFPMIASGKYAVTAADVAGLRLKAGDRLGVHLQMGVAMVPWPGQVHGVKQLAVGMDPEGVPFEIFSVSGERSATYIVLGNAYHRPIRFTETFISHDIGFHLENGLIHIDELNRDLDTKDMRRYADIFANAAAEAAKNPRRENFVPELESPATFDTSITHPRPRVRVRLDRPPLPFVTHYGHKELLKNSIELLDSGAFPGSESERRTLTDKVLRAMIFSEFPELVLILRSNTKTEPALREAHKNLYKLWVSGRVSGAVIQSTLRRRLEANVEDRANCELKLTAFKGPGKQEADYRRGLVLKSLNTLHRLLWRGESH